VAVVVLEELGPQGQILQMEWVETEDHQLHQASRVHLLRMLVAAVAARLVLLVAQAVVAVQLTDQETIPHHLRQVLMAAAVVAAAAGYQPEEQEVTEDLA